MSGKPHIFISYRRSDDMMLTGRIYDHLCNLFDEAHIFKDMENIPAGADFRVVLEQAIESSNIVLLIIGQKWLTLTDSAGNRRLDDPNDFVRIEIETALKQPHILLIPVLVDGAEMPHESDLPTSLSEIAYRNAVQVRSDPDFSRDVQYIYQQIRDHPGVAVPLQPAKLPFQRAAALGAAAALILILVSAFLFLHNRNVVSKTAPTATPEFVVNVAADRYLILVAQPDPLRSPTPRDVASYITDNLVTTLDQNAHYAETTTQTYPTVIKTSDEARAVAEKTGAAVIVWGSYTDQDVTLHLQIGSLANFKHFQLSRALLERTMNVTMQLTDERVQSLAEPVLAMLFMTQMINDDAFEALSTTAVISFLETDSSPAMISGSSVGANMHRAIASLFNNPRQSLQYATQASQDDPANPLINVSIALLDVRLDDTTGAHNALLQAKALDAHWIMPLYVETTLALAGNDNAAAIQTLDSIVPQLPDSWFAVYLRGAAHFLNGDYAAAEADVDKSLALVPHSNLPYLVGLVIKQRTGELSQVGDLYRVVKRDYPDPTFGARIVELAIGKNAPTAFQGFFELMGALLVGKYGDVITESDTLLKATVFKSNVALSTVYLARGLAYCNLDDTLHAGDAYTTGLTYDANNVSLYLLRSDVRNQQKNTLGAASDLALAELHSSGLNITPYVQGHLSGESNCKNVLNFIMALPTATAAVH